MNDVFKDMQVKVGCDYLSDRKRTIVRTIN